MPQRDDAPKRGMVFDEPETVEELHAGLGGRWLVTTQRSRHVWDLDAMTYQFLPGAGRNSFTHDGCPCPIGRVEVWPAVGRSSLIFFDDPDNPLVEHWRVCSTIRSITRLPADTKSDQHQV